MNGKQIAIKHAHVEFAILRIVFGCIWAVDAFFKWRPEFINGFMGYLTNSLDGQPSAVQWWLNEWIRLVQTSPHIFAHTIAIVETLIAIGLILGIFPRIVSYGGIALSLVIWSTAEAFGGPYGPGSTDVGSALIYALVFFALMFGQGWSVWSLQSVLRKGE
jgi:uncharacterized membrane protein YphA (DoxX/SURF4 family)